MKEVILIDCRLSYLNVGEAMLSQSFVSSSALNEKILRDYIEKNWSVLRFGILGFKENAWGLGSEVVPKECSIIPCYGFHAHLPPNERTKLYAGYDKVDVLKPAEQLFDELKQQRIKWLLDAMMLKLKNENKKEITENCRKVFEFSQRKMFFYMAEVGAHSEDNFYERCAIKCYRTPGNRYFELSPEQGKVVEAMYESLPGSWKNELNTYGNEKRFARKYDIAASVFAIASAVPLFLIAVFGMLFATAVMNPVGLIITGCIAAMIIFTAISCSIVSAIAKKHANEALKSAAKNIFQSETEVENSSSFKKYPVLATTTRRENVGVTHKLAYSPPVFFSAAPRSAVLDVAKLNESTVMPRILFSQ